MTDSNSPGEILTSPVTGTVFGIQQEIHPPAISTDPVTKTIAHSAGALLDKQYTNGYWRFDLEADTTIPAEYLFLQYFLNNVDHERESRLAEYILSRQKEDGSWPLYEGGPGNISATVKSYLALKLAGKDPASPAMKLARKWILNHGGAENANVFTRITLAIFGQLPWRTVPAILAEVIWLPRWFLLFNLHKVSYWSRCVIVPLLILFAKKPVHQLQPGQDIAEIFINDPAKLKHLDRFNQSSIQKNTFILVDRCLKILERVVPAWLRNLSIRKVESWMRDHMRGEGGIGAIFPAMANAVMALKVLGCDNTDPDMQRGIQAIEDLVLENETETYVQPCVSPIWDTCLSISALSETGVAEEHPAIISAIDWLFEKQVFVRGDWSINAPDLDSGGWAFQFENDFYPDVDDTSMVVMAMIRAGVYKHPEKRRKLAQAVNWVLGMQNPDGGWGAFDIDNHYEYLNNIPFADHGALVDPSTSDLTGRCIEMLAMLGYDRSFPPIARGIDFLLQEQETNGSWYGRWGVNYIYGTWAVLVALGALGEDPGQPYIRKAIKWLNEIQNSDGGWGESCDCYDDPELKGYFQSTASQTAWALLGLMASGEVHSESVTRGIHFLTRNYEGEGSWQESPYTGTGFPRVFYLRYHGYSHYFPLWALGVYRNMKQGIPTRQEQICSGDPIELGPMPVLQIIKQIF
jgi:squalene-hopene/tetraprenyl-beta-curcumene cyclase